MAGLYNWPRSRSLGSAFCYVALKALKANEPDIKTTLEDILTKKHLCVDRNFDLVSGLYFFILRHKLVLLEPTGCLN